MYFLIYPHSYLLYFLTKSKKNFRNINKVTCKGNFFYIHMRSKGRSRSVSIPTYNVNYTRWNNIFDDIGKIKCAQRSFFARFYDDDISTSKGRSTFPR